jgi:hypothetical protein
MLLPYWQKPKDKKNIKKQKKQKTNKTKTQTIITQYQSKAPHEASL